MGGAGSLFDHQDAPVTPMMGMYSQCLWNHRCPRWHCHVLLAQIQFYLKLQRSLLCMLMASSLQDLEISATLSSPGAMSACEKHLRSGHPQKPYEINEEYVSTLPCSSFFFFFPTSAVWESLRRLLKYGSFCTKLGLSGHSSPCMWSSWICLGRSPVAWVLVSLARLLEWLFLPFLAHVLHPAWDHPGVPSQIS